MALIDDIKVSLRVVSEKTDSEVQMLIDAALLDLERVGVNPALLEVDPEAGLSNALVKNAVTTYCKWQFGYDVTEAYRFESAYDRIVRDLLNSAENIAAIEQAAARSSDEEPEGGTEPEEGSEPPDGQEGGE